MISMSFNFNQNLSVGYIDIVRRYLGYSQFEHIIRSQTKVPAFDL